MIRIITDTASDITFQQAENMNIELVELPITFADGLCPQKTEEDFVTFYNRLMNCEQLPITSRPSPEIYLEMFKRAEEDQDDVLVLTLSSGLSGTYESALIAQKLVGYSRVHVVDTHQAILTQRMLVEHAVCLREEGYDVEAIAQRITEIRDQVVVCGVVDTLKYLRMGGRIPASLAMLGKVLHIKPVIILQDTTLKTLGKARSYQAGVNMLYKQLEADGYNKAYPLYFGYTSNRELGERFMKDTKERYGLTSSSLHPIGGIIGTHCGTDCVAVAYMKLAN